MKLGVGLVLTCPLPTYFTQPSTVTSPLPLPTHTHTLTHIPLRSTSTSSPLPTHTHPFTLHLYSHLRTPSPPPRHLSTPTVTPPHPQYYTEPQPPHLYPHLYIPDLPSSNALYTSFNTYLEFYPPSPTPYSHTNLLVYTPTPHIFVHIPSLQPPCPPQHLL